MMIVGSPAAQQRAALQQESDSEDSELASDHQISSAVARQLVDIEILYLLNFGPKSGYELRKLLSTGFGIRVSYGTLYPHLHALEKSRLISGTWSQKEGATPLKKRVYALSPLGIATLKDSVKSLGSISMTMQFLTNHVELSTGTATEAALKSYLAPVESSLSRRGYAVKKGVAVKGLSGLEHLVEFLALRNIETPGAPATRMLLKFMDSQAAITLDQVLKLHVVANDILAKVLLFSPLPLKKEVKELAEFYNMQIHSGDSWQSSFEAGLEMLLNNVRKPAAPLIPAER